MVREDKDGRSAACGRRGNEKRREEIERLRETVGCQVVLEAAGFALDVKESTRRAMKYRRSAEIIIVTHAGRGWFDPLSDNKGDIFGLVTSLERCDFGEGCAWVAALCGLERSESFWRRDDCELKDTASISEDWKRRRSPSRLKSSVCETAINLLLNDK
ncbi:hypothetical protein [Pseudochrobactrum sp. AO18b]|uniref:hypothetical protein n=1 Tax=Pseudochrobactrum sp. AO18b TaxID=1201036 RepID=UPI0003B49569|nr:hypothetical protein [Pseudochrobactrum sp. AO18b]